MSDKEDSRQGNISCEATEPIFGNLTEEYAFHIKTDDDMYPRIAGELLEKLGSRPRYVSFVDDILPFWDNKGLGHGCLHFKSEPIMFCYDEETLEIGSPEPGRKLAAKLGMHTLSIVRWLGPENLKCDGIDFTGAQDIRGLFALFAKLRYLDLSGCDFSAVVAADEAFRDCENLETLIFPEVSQRINAPAMFKGCSRLKQGDIPANLQNMVTANAFIGYYACNHLPGNWENDFRSVQVRKLPEVPAIAILRDRNALSGCDNHEFAACFQQFWTKKAEIFLWEEVSRQYEIGRETGSTQPISAYCSGLYKKPLMDYLPKFLEEIEQQPLDTVMEALRNGVPVEDILI